MNHPVLWEVYLLRHRHIPGLKCSDHNFILHTEGRAWRRGVLCTKDILLYILSTKHWYFAFQSYFCTTFIFLRLIITWAQRNTDRHVNMKQANKPFVLHRWSRRGQSIQCIPLIRPMDISKVTNIVTYSRLSGQTKRTNPIWICIWFGDTKIANFP